jgi:hypothetical protein
MQWLEIFTSDGIFIALPQKPNVVGAFQLLNPARISPKFLEIPPHRA